MAEPTGAPAPRDLEPTQVFLTPKALVDRWGGDISVQTLRKWRWQRRGPDFVKIGDGKNSPVRYRLDDVEAYEKARTKACRRDLAGDG